MNASVFFLALRRMRAPLIVLIVIYAVSTLGLTLIPGVDAQGRSAPPMKKPKFKVAASTIKKPKTTFSRFMSPPSVRATPAAAA